MDVFEKVKGMIVEQLGVDEEEVKKETSFKDLNADSLDIVELVMAMEEEFDLEISDEQVEKIKTVGDVTEYLEANIS
ncbi:MAG: acyl carrier protein [Candidatus Contubernalis sp.]|nr:acyl carrier protein [Candidatus Contubernalis sp.]